MSTRIGRILYLNTRNYRTPNYLLRLVHIWLHFWKCKTSGRRQNRATKDYIFGCFNNSSDRSNYLNYLKEITSDLCMGGHQHTDKISGKTWDLRNSHLFLDRRNHRQLENLNLRLKKYNFVWLSNEKQKPKITLYF